MQTFIQQSKIKQGFGISPVKRTEKQAYDQSHEPKGQKSFGNSSHDYSSSNIQHRFSQMPIFAGTGAFIQPKLKINTPGDVYEQEADQMADKVMQMTEPSIQRQCTECEEEGVIQKKAQDSKADIASASLTSQISHASGSGNPLEDSPRAFMESRFGMNFNPVRIHTGSTAESLNTSLNARAFTHGSDIYFNKGQYNPSSGEGKKLLAHELVHTIQQAKGLSHGMIQKEGDDKKKEAVKTEVEVVTEHDFTKDETKVEGTTTRTSEQAVAPGVTAKATEKTTGAGTTGTAEVKVKDKSSGLSAAGGVKAESPADTTQADKFKVFIKVGGNWKLFDSKLTLGTTGGLEYDFKKAPKYSLSGNMAFIPNGVVSPEIVAGLVFDDKGTSGNIGANLTWRVTEALSLKAGADVGVDAKGKLSVKGGAGIALSF